MEPRGAQGEYLSGNLKPRALAVACRSERLARDCLPALSVVAYIFCAAAFDAYAQAYPTRPVRVVVATAAASGADIAARAVGAKLGANLAQQFVIDNRPGAAGNIAGEAVARATPDGYTLLVMVAGMTINPALYSKLNYNLEKDFASIGLIASAPLVLAIHAAVPAKTVQELITYAKSRPGQLRYASSGSGSSPHLSAEIFRMQTGIDIVHVPYKGSPQAVTDLLAGEVNMMLAATSSLLPHAQSGRLRALAVGSLKRTSIAPDLPTMSESGLPGYEAITWSGLLAPAGTSPEIVNRLNRELVSALGTADVRAQLAAQKFDPMPSTATEFAAYLRSELAKWGKTVRAVGAKVD